MQDQHLHLVAGVGTALLAALLALPLGLAARADAPEHTHLDDMVVIEASLAMRTSSKKITQPQKDTRPPDPTKKPDGVSRDENKKPVDKKDEDKKKDDPKTPDLDISKFKHPSDDSAPGPVVQPFDPNAKQSFDGLDTATKGDPWLGALKADMHFQPPEIARGNSTPVGCIRLSAEGKIVDSKFEQKSDDDLQTAAEAAIKQVTDTRNAHPLAVPTQLLPLTSAWLCFKFNVKS